MFQRQLSKEGLQKVVDKEQATDAKSQVSAWNQKCAGSCNYSLMLEKLKSCLVLRVQVNILSTEDLRDLFTLREDIR